MLAAAANNRRQRYSNVDNSRFQQNIENGNHHCKTTKLQFVYQTERSKIGTDNRANTDRRNIQATTRNRHQKIRL